MKLPPRSRSGGGDRIPEMLLPSSSQSLPTSQEQPPFPVSTPKVSFWPLWLICTSMSVYVYVCTHVCAGAHELRRPHVKAEGLPQLLHLPFWDKASIVQGSPPSQSVIIFIRSAGPTCKRSAGAYSLLTRHKGGTGSGHGIPPPPRLSIHSLLPTSCMPFCPNYRWTQTPAGLSMGAGKG